MISTFLIVIDNNKKSWAANQYIRMISEGSCDTEDWSNDAEISALHHRIKLYINIQVHLNKLECRGKVHLFQ